MTTQQSLKIERNTYQKMRLTQIAIIFSVLMFFLINVNMASAVFTNQFQDFRPDNHTTQILINVINSKGDSIPPSTFSSFSTFLVQPSTAIDLLFGNKQAGSNYQFSIKYDLYPKTFNEQVGFNMISFCTINVTSQKFYSSLNGQTATPVITELFKNVSDTDTNNQELYLALDSGDQAQVKVDCYFTNSSDRSLIIPATVFVNSPTLECTLCKKFQWSKIQPALSKAEFLQQANIDNVEKIKRIFFIIYEFIIIFYWILLIFLVIGSIGLIFYLAYRIYKYFEGLVK